MPNLNKVILIGHLTADPELKKTENDVSVTSFSIGVSRGYAKKGEQPQSDFPNIVAWRSTADFIAKYFHKGDAICICGSLQTRNYTDKDGHKRYITEVVANEAHFMKSKEKRGDLEESDDLLPNLGGNTPKYEEIGIDEDLPF